MLVGLAVWPTTPSSLTKQNCQARIKHGLNREAPWFSGERQELRT